MLMAFHSAAETQKFAQKIARTLKPRGGRAATLALAGELGSGKTTFAQAFAQALGVKAKVLSPTFILMQPFKLLNLETFKSFSTLWHVDCYRLERPEELERLGFKDILNNPKNIVVVEWADKVRRLLPKDALWIRFEHGKEENERRIIINPKSKFQMSNQRLKSKIQTD